MFFVLLGKHPQFQPYNSHEYLVVVPSAVVFHAMIAKMYKPHLEYACAMEAEQQETLHNFLKTLVGSEENFTFGAVDAIEKIYPGKCPACKS